MSPYPLEAPVFLRATACRSTAICCGISSLDTQAPFSYVIFAKKGVLITSLIAIQQLGSLRKDRIRGYVWTVMFYAFLVSNKREIHIFLIHPLPPEIQLVIRLTGFDGGAPRNNAGRSSGKQKASALSANSFCYFIKGFSFDPMDRLFFARHRLPAIALARARRADLPMGKKK